jgi:hypothetical protein
LLGGPAKVPAQTVAPANPAPPPPKPAATPIATVPPIAAEPTPPLSPPALADAPGTAALIATAPPAPRRSHRGLIVGLTLGGVALVGGAIAVGLVFGLGPSYPAASGQAHLH